MFNLNQKMGGLCCRILPALLAGFMMAMFAGCSNEGATDGPLTGGGAEETGVYALDNISLAGVLQNLKIYSVDEDSIVYEEAPEGATIPVNIYELDPVTFEKTGVSFFGFANAWTGAFKIDGISVTSPYLIVETDSEAFHYDEAMLFWRSDLIDVRKTRNLTLNALSTLSSQRMLKLVSSGVDFKSAKAQTEKEVLKAFAIYDEMPSFESLMLQESSIQAKAFYSMMNYFLVMNTFGHFAALVEDFAEDGIWDGDWDGGREWKGKLVSHWSNTINLARNSLIAEMTTEKELFEESLSFFGVDSNDSELKNLARSYLFNLFEVTDNIGRCTAERQGEKTSIVSNTKVIVCDSGFWSVMEQGYVHEDGEMVDSRDGKTYKTITINVKGEPVTWMAENLAYEVPSSVCFNNEEENCQKYGRMYTLDVSHGIEIDSLQMLIDGDKYEVAEVMSGRNPQGICPDGWRLPRLSDWEKFTKYYGGGRLTQMRDRLVDGADPKYDIGFNASMGGTGSMDLESKEFSFYSLGEGIDYAMWDGNGYQFRMSFAETFMQSISLSISYENVDVVYVRCVKQKFLLGG